MPTQVQQTNSWDGFYQMHQYCVPLLVIAKDQRDPQDSVPASAMEMCPHRSTQPASDIGQGTALRACGEGVQKSGVKDRVMFCGHVCGLCAGSLTVCQRMTIGLLAWSDAPVAI